MSNEIQIPHKKTVNKSKFVSKKCFVKNCCVTNLSVPKKTLHSFPSRESKNYKIWCDLCQLSESEKNKIKKYVCEIHFDSYR